MLLSTLDTARLTRVASFPHMDRDARERMLDGTSERAKAVGRIVIEGPSPSDTADNILLASKFVFE